MSKQHGSTETHVMELTEEGVGRSAFENRGQVVLTVLALALVFAISVVSIGARQEGRSSAGNGGAAYETAVVSGTTDSSGMVSAVSEANVSSANSASNTTDTDSANSTDSTDSTDGTDGASSAGNSTYDSTAATSETAAATDSFIKVTPTEEELLSLLETVEDEARLLFQGRYIPISSHAEPCAFQPGDFSWDGDRMRYNGTAYTASFGIDVSAYHNRDHGGGSLDWEAAKADGVEFAIIRVAYRGTTEGALYEDPFYETNLDGASAAGILTGAYLYSQAVTVEEALEEADFLLRRLEGHTIDGPVCYDWEISDRSSRAWFVSPETATACADAFCSRVAEAGYTPMIYASKDVGYLKYDQSVLEPYMRWYPQYPDRRAQTPCPDFLYQMDLWQFSDRCAVAGIGKRTDGSLWLRPVDDVA